MKRTIITLASAATGLALALALATPATAGTASHTLASSAGPLASPASSAAATTPDTGPTPQQQSALDRYLADATSSVPLKVPALKVPAQPNPAQPSPAQPNATTSSVRVITVTAGRRIIHTHGTTQLWSSNTLEWYWNSSRIASSTGWQDVGYAFPNTASKGGIKRTLVTNTDHNWRGTVTIGIGTPTPWGNVDVYKTSVTDTYQLKRGGSYIVN